MALRWIFGDVETTGVSTTDRVVEIAWIEVDDDLNVLNQVSSLIDPQMPIPAGASAVHGITNQDVVGAPTIDQFMATAGLDQGDVCLVAHSSGFDARYFGPFLSPGFNQLCTLRLARRFWPDADNHKLQTLRYMLGLAGGRAHSADGDLAPLVDLVRVMLAQTGYSLYELLDLSYKPLPISKMTFGKHKGVELTKLPRGYVSWLLGLDNLDDDLRASLESL